MDREELRYHEEARRKGVSLNRRGEDSWSIGAPPAIDKPGQHIVPSEPSSRAIASGWPMAAYSSAR